MKSKFTRADKANSKFYNDIVLHGYDNIFTSINGNVDHDRENGDDIYFYQGIYTDYKKMNTLYLAQIRVNDEPTDDMSVCINSILDEAYTYLVNELNTHKHLSVFITNTCDGCENLESRFLIVYDCFGKDCLYDIDYIDRIVSENCKFNYSYIIDGRLYEISDDDIISCNGNRENCVKNMEINSTNELTLKSLQLNEYINILQDFRCGDKDKVILNNDKEVYKFIDNMLMKQGHDCSIIFAIGLDKSVTFGIKIGNCVNIYATKEDDQDAYLDIHEIAEEEHLDYIGVIVEVEKGVYKVLEE